jgi:hypothetical protein
MPPNSTPTPMYTVHNTPGSDSKYQWCTATKRYAGWPLLGVTRSTRHCDRACMQMHFFTYVYNGLYDLTFKTRYFLLSGADTQHAHAVFTPGLTTLIVIIIIIIRHELGINRLVSTSSNSLCKGLPSRLRSFGLHFSIIFGILLLFVLVMCRS